MGKKEKEAINNILEKQHEISFTGEGVEEKPIIIEDKKDLDFRSRGFETLDQAYDFINTYYFKHLGKADQDEYMNWLK